MSDTVLYEVRDRIAWVTLNRPERLNALNAEMQASFVAALDRAEADDEVHAVVVQGAGRSFCAGADSKRDTDSGLVHHSNPPADRVRLEAGLRAWMRVWDLRIPVVAKVHGHCLGRGTQLAIIADVTFCTEDAVIGAPQIPLGAGFNIVFWAWQLGAKKAKELFLPVGETITGREAADIGLFNKALPADRLDAYVETYARKLAATPRDILGLEKLAANKTQEVQGFREALGYGVEIDAIAHQSPAILEIGRQIRERGLKAVIDERKAFERSLE